MPSEERYWSFLGDNLSGRFLPPPRELGIQTSLLNHFCSPVKKWITFTWHLLNGDQRRIIFQHSICFWVNFGWWGEIKYRCPCLFPPPRFNFPSNIYLSSKSDCALRQDWALSIENRNSMHCTGSYQVVLKGQCQNTFELKWSCYFWEYFHQQCKSRGGQKSCFVPAKSLIWLNLLTKF